MELISQDWKTALQWAIANDDVKVIVQTGRGKYYTTGDLSRYRGTGTDFQAPIYHPIPPSLDLKLRATGLRTSSPLLLYYRDSLTVNLSKQ